MAGKVENIAVEKVGKDTLTFNIVGTSPFVCNAMATHGARALLMPAPKKSQKEREATVKHNPPEEFRSSIYRSKDEAAPTLIEFPSAGFKRAMASAALELPGVNKSQIGRLCWAEGHMVSIYGIPELWMTMVRQAGMARTPDVRTRAIVPDWAARVTVSYVTPNLRATPVANLLAAAGVFIGVGDGRPEKGALSFGRFEIVDESDERYRRIVATGVRNAQIQAMDNPTCFDLESEELLEWWKAEVRRRGFQVA
jgi:hypothetical protein